VIAFWLFLFDRTIAFRTGEAKVVDTMQPKYLSQGSTPFQGCSGFPLDAYDNDQMTKTK
jgi:hypothetical protein